VIAGLRQLIGKEIALELSTGEASVVVNFAKSASKAEELVAAIIEGGSKAIAMKSNVINQEKIFKLFEQALEHLERLYHVLSNSGTEG
jgi:NAD(P)-dependent dehydrogenase (short-subunit alcohol dehydrogenase family)